MQNAIPYKMSWWGRDASAGISSPKRLPEVRDVFHDLEWRNGYDTSRSKRTLLHS